MTQDAIMVLEVLFDTIWQLFNSWHIPGTRVTPAAAFLFLLCASIGLKFLGRIIGISVPLEEAVAAQRDLSAVVRSRRYPRNAVHSNVIMQGGRDGFDPQLPSHY